MDQDSSTRYICYRLINGKEDFEFEVPEIGVLEAISNAVPDAQYVDPMVTPRAILVDEGMAFVTGVHTGRGYTTVTLFLIEESSWTPEQTAVFGPMREKAKKLSFDEVDSAMAPIGKVFAQVAELSAKMHASKPCYDLTVSLIEDALFH